MMVGLCPLVVAAGEGFCSSRGPTAPEGCDGRMRVYVFEWNPAKRAKIGKTFEGRLSRSGGAGLHS